MASKLSAFQLIELLAPMGVSQRLVRTSVFRLTREGWLMAEKVGRRSYYGLTGAGRRRFEKAFKRVYSGVQPAWDGAWTLVVLNQLNADLRRDTRQELEWMGFGAFAPTVLAHPGVDRAELKHERRVESAKACVEAIFVAEPFSREWVSQVWKHFQMNVTRV